MRAHDGPTFHYAAHPGAPDQIHMGAALCGAGRAARTEGEQYVTGEWTYVTCRNCERRQRAAAARDRQRAGE
jgi:hypothetical protein